MIEFTNFTLFVVASWALIITPGPDMLYVITSGVSQGRKAGVLSALGVTSGLLVHTTLAALGLAVILSTSALAFTLVKYVGAVYLIYLGIRSWRDKESFSFETDTRQMSWSSVFAQGMMSNLFNPKVALFFLAFLPQFVSPEFGNISIQMVVLGITFALFGVMFLLLVGYFSGVIGHWIAGKQLLARSIRWVTGSILVGLGLRLAFIERR